MKYADWEATVPEAIRGDTLWRVEAYRLSLYLSDLAWADVGTLLHDPRTNGIANQLYRAVGNISSNISEGYSKNSGKARSIFYEYALGSARESRDWYFKARHVLGSDHASDRMELATQIVRLALTMAKNERRLNRKVISD